MSRLRHSTDSAVFLSNSARMPFSIGSISLKARNFM